MSDFACEHCGVINQDSQRGYVAACPHNPTRNSRTVILRFDDTGERDCEGFYAGSFYRSKEGGSRKKSVHPIRWFDRGVVSSPLDSVDQDINRICKTCKHYRFAAIAFLEGPIYCCDLHKSRTTDKDTCDQWEKR